MRTPAWTLGSDGWHAFFLRVAVLAVLPLLLVGCSESAADIRERASQQVADLGDALAEAVILSYQASQGRIDADAGTRAVSEARVLTLELSETGAALQTDEQGRTVQLVELANRAIVWVGQGEYEQAEKLRLEEFIPAAEAFDVALDSAEANPRAADTTRLSTGTAIGVLSVIAAGGLLVFMRYRRGDLPDPIVEARRRKAERSGQPLEPIERKWSDITPLITDDAPEPETADDSDPVRSPNARSIEVDLRGLLMTALHQVKDYGWEMSIVCPEIRIDADPVKLRQAVLGVLGTAFMGGATRVGIVVEDLDGHVLLSIGRDAPPDRADAERAAEKFTGQVRLALGTEALDYTLINDDEVSLVSIPLGRKIGADEVSEPVA